MPMMHIRAAWNHASFRSCCILLLLLLLVVVAIVIGRVISCTVRHAASFIGRILISSKSELHCSKKSGVALLFHCILLEEDVLSVHFAVAVVAAATVPNPAKWPIQLPIATVATPTEIGIIVGRVPVDNLSSLYWMYCEEKDVA